MLFDNSDFENSKQWIINIKNFKPKCDKQEIFIVMCTWKRFHNIKKTIISMEKQNIKINLCIWNNNYNEKNILLKQISNIKNVNVKINVFHSLENIGGIGRFVMVNHICSNICDYNSVFFIDDDQIFHKDFIKKMNKTYSKFDNCAVFWFSKLFNTKHILDSNDPYWTPQSYNTLNNIIPKHIIPKLKKNRIENTIYNVDYGGTCGCIYPTYIFKDFNIFKFNKKYRYIEDLLLSYLFKYEYNGKLIVDLNNNHFVKIIQDNDEETAQFYKLKEKKNELLKLLHQHYVTDNVNFLISSGWFSDVEKKSLMGKITGEHLEKKEKYGCLKTRSPEFSEKWLSSILNQSIQPKKISILDACSVDKMSDAIYNNPLVEVNYQLKNYGHGAYCEKHNILCGWARGVLHGAMQAYLNDLDFVYIEQDLLLFGKDFLKNIFSEMEKKEKMICYMEGSETIHKIQQSLIIVKHAYLNKYISDLLLDTNHNKPEEEKHFNIINNDKLLICPYRGGRQRKNLNNQYYCLQHLTNYEYENLKI